LSNNSFDVKDAKKAFLLDQQEKRKRPSLHQAPSREPTRAPDADALDASESSSSDAGGRREASAKGKKKKKKEKKHKKDKTSRKSKREFDELLLRVRPSSPPHRLNLSFASTTHDALPP
jgi:hypothetical protein